MAVSWLLNGNEYLLTKWDDPPSRWWRISSKFPPGVPCGAFTGAEWRGSYAFPTESQPLWWDPRWSSEFFQTLDIAYSAWCSPLSQFSLQSNVKKPPLKTRCSDGGLGGYIFLNRSEKRSDGVEFWEKHELNRINLPVISGANRNLSSSLVNLFPFSNGNLRENTSNHTLQIQLYKNLCEYTSWSAIPKDRCACEVDFPFSEKILTSDSTYKPLVVPYHIIYYLKAAVSHHLFF